MAPQQPPDEDEGVWLDEAGLADLLGREVPQLLELRQATATRHEFTGLGAQSLFGSGKDTDAN